MQNQVNSSLAITFSSLFIMWYPVYIIWKDFNIDYLIKFWESIITYKYRILWIIIVNLLIMARKIIPYKKSKIIQLFLQWRSTIIIISTFIYPLLPDFKQRFWRISQENVTDFYAIILPIFIMVFLSSIMKIWDPDVVKEMKNTIWINNKTNHETDLFVKKSSIFTMLSFYCFIFAILTARISIIRKTSPQFAHDFSTYPLLFFLFIFGISILLYKILDNYTEKNDKKSKNSTSNNLKGKKQKNYENVKVSFK